MNKEPIRIGIVGVGQIGKSHLETYSKIPGATLVAASDVNADALSNVSEKYNIPHTYTDFHEMLKRDDIDAVDVCLHNNMHAPVTIAALKAGKHVYCEKPMAGTYIDAKAMMDTAKECNLNLSIQLSTLFSKETRVARILIDEGKLGKIYHARSTGFRRRGRPFVDGYGTASFVQKKIAAGGALYDMGVYHIARMLYLMNMPKINRISGKVYQEMEMDKKRQAESNFDVEELGLGFVKFDGGLTLDIIESWSIYLDGFEGSSIVGSEGGIRLDPFSFHTLIADMDLDATFGLNTAVYRWQQLGDEKGAYNSPQHHWIAALQGHVKLLPTAELALQTMLISEGIYQSDKLGREVSAEEVEELSVSTAIDM